jgi:polysaccharide chain length determinant protein (PEP-CTERM system associated)
MTSSSPSGFSFVTTLARRRWRLFLITSGAAFAIAAGLALGLPDLYRARASLLVEQLPDTLNGSDSVSRVDARLQAIKQEALSRQRLLDLANQFNLYPKLREANQLDAVIARAQRDVRVEIISTVQQNGTPNTVAFTVSYVSTDPATAAAVANRLAAFYVDQNDAMRSKRAAQTTDLLQGELEKTRQRLAAQEGRIIAFSSGNSGALPQQVTATMAKYTGISQQLQANMSDQTRLTERRDALQNQIAELMTPRLNTNSLDPQVQLAQARRELAGLRLQFSDNHPDVRAKLAEIRTLEQSVNARGGQQAAAESTQVSTLQSQIAGINTRLDELAKQRQQLEASMRQYDSVLSQAPVRDVQLETLTRDLQSTRDQYDALQRRYQEASLAERAEGTGGEEFRVLDPAVAVNAPTTPSRVVLVGAALVLSLVFGLAVAFVRDRLDDSFHTVDDIRAFTRVPVLAAIPAIATPEERSRRVFMSSLTAIAGSVALALIGLQVYALARHSDVIARLLVR